MAKYIYRARDLQGKQIRGTYEGESQDAVLTALKSRGLIVTQDPGSSSERF